MGGAAVGRGKKQLGNGQEAAKQGVKNIPHSDPFLEPYSSRFVHNGAGIVAYYSAEG